MRSILIALFISLPSFAEYRVEGKTLDLVKCPEGTCLISSSCLKRSCLALKATQERQKGVLGTGGTNPGSAVCQKYHNAKVVIAAHEKGGTNAFCSFTDGSVISLDGLWIW